MSDRHHLILTSPKLDSRLKSVKYLKTVTTEVVEYNLLSPWDTKSLTGRVKAVASEFEVRFTPTAISLLVETLGNDTAKLYSEIEKLSLYSSGKLIEEADVKALTLGSTVTALDLVKAILTKDINETLKIYRQLSNHPLQILASVNTQIRRYFWVKAFVQEGLTNEEIASLLGLGNPGRVYYLKQEIVRVDMTRLKTLLQTLSEAERKIKQGTPLFEYVLQLTLDS